MDIQILTSPYDSGVHGVRMGAGPRRLLEAGLEDHLRGLGHRTHVNEIHAPRADVASEVHTAFGLAAELSMGIRRAREQHRLPVVLAGSCYSALGTVAGVSDLRPGVLWFDTHADFNTPETTGSGFIDGMAVAILTGRCWANLSGGIPGFEAVPEETVLMLGIRDLDPAEVELLSNSTIGQLPPVRYRLQLEAALDALRERVDHVYVHLDLDVIDPAEARANALAAPDGLSVAEVGLDAIRDRFTIAAVAPTAYDPAVDPEGRVCDAAFRLLDRVFA